MKRRSQRRIVSLEDRQLVLNSEVIKNYPELKALLERYERIYESDFTDLTDFTPDNQNLLLYSFGEIVKEASKEWVASYDNTQAVSDFRDDWVNCALCDTPNKYIFFIQNKLNRIRLNVGSECINKFPHLDGKIEGESVEKIKRNRIKELNKIKRIAKFNEMHPGVLNKIKIWEEEYENRPIVMPIKIHAQSQELFKNMRTCYNEYIEGKAGDGALHKFGVYIKDYNSISIMADKHVEKNMGEQFICTKEVKDWLKNTDYPNLINVIMRDEGILRENTIKFIHKDSFVEKFEESFKVMFQKTPIILDHFENRLCIFSYRRPKSPYSFIFSCTYQELMKVFGHYLTNPLEQIQEQEIIDNILPLWERQNIEKIEDWVNLVLDKTPYKIKIDFDSRTIEYYDNSNKQYTKGDVNVFLKAQKKLLFSDEKVAKEKFISLFTKTLSTWISYKEKKRFEFDDISRVTYGK